MPGLITIHDGELAVKDPADISVYRFDWDTEHLATGVTITTSTFTLTELETIAAWDALVDYVIGDRVVVAGVVYTNILASLNQTPPNVTYWAVTGAALTKDQESIVTGLRTTQLRLTGGTAGQTYKVDNKIVTNETPTQTKDRHFFLLVQDK